MAAAKKVPHLKDNNGSWAYRRRVPKRHHKTLGFEVWNEPCGDVTYAEAVTKVLEWTKQHDKQIELLDNPTFAAEVRRDTESYHMEPKINVVVDAMQTGVLANTFDPLQAAIAGLKAAEENPELDDQDRFVRYRAIMDASFGDHVAPPKDIDDREYFDLIKRKIERRIIDIDGDPNTINAVAEKAFDFRKIKPQVRNKYRRNIRMLIDLVGDIPIKHLTSAHLRELRATKSHLEASAVSSIFTPIKTMMKFAIDEEIIENNPMNNVSMPTENRSIDEIRHKPFPPEEAQRIFEAIEQYWTKPIRGMKEERRKAIWWVTRVQAFTAMRPKEVVDMSPENINDRWIKVEKSKTSSSTRYIPLHPEIAGFVEFVHSGGLDNLDTQKKDKVQTVSRAFHKLIRKQMDPPILDPKKALYSWRSSFSNAMRRAGADLDMRRSILGHRIPGSLAHYDDGPEFFKKRKWIKLSDTRTVYPDPGEDDDLD